jgi:alpha-glucosidase
MVAPARLRRQYQWWERGVLYEVYPRSFRDSDGDGVGDLAGIRAQLPYLEWLGVDAIWIAPFYPSPMKDFGYDICDYTAVDPRFGDMAEFDRLLAEAHRRGLRVVLDLVPNHSSDQHPWFREACRSRDDPRRDWYLWADARPDGSPPNNWLSEFGGSAWQWHAPTGQYYYHAFDVSQPDLNWRNPAVHRAFFAIMRHWMDKGVDGFRVDVMWHLLKDPQLRDNPPNPGYDPRRDSPYHALKPVYSTDQPDVHHVVAEMRAVLDEYDDRLMIGEIYLPIDELVKYYGVERSEAQMPFNFHLISTPWNATEIHALVDEYEASVPPDRWPNWVLGNHDQPRVASRIGAAQARVAAVLLLTLRGTPTLYYGEELGMPDVQVPPDLAHDPREVRAPGKGLGRDPYRAPMPWDRTANAGFTRGRPWLPLPIEWRDLNVATQCEEAQSMLRLYHDLLALRRREPALAVGEQEALDVKAPLFGYVRRAEDGAGRCFAMVLNMSPTEQSCELATHRGPIAGRIVLSTRRSRDGEPAEGRLRLAPDEALIIQVD